LQLSKQVLYLNQQTAINMKKFTIKEMPDLISGHPFERMMTNKEWALFETNRSNQEITILPFTQNLYYYTATILAYASNDGTYPIQQFVREAYKDFILMAFFISDSPEGFDFWNEIANRKFN
jgi:hypothetical protein